MAKVLLITNIFPPQIGGPATFIDRLAHSLSRRRRDVTVVCSSTTARDDTDRERPFTVRRVSLESREQYEIRVRIRLLAEMLRHRLIFVNGLERYVAQVNRLLRCRYILKVVGDTVWETARNRGLTTLSIDDFQIDPGAQAQFAGDIAVRNDWVAAASHIVVPSHYLRRMVERWGVDARRITVVPNGSTITSVASPRARVDGEPLRVLFVGRLTNWKGVETLLLAARLVPHVDVEIVGDGPAWPHLVELAAQLGLDGRVVFRGRLDAAGVSRAMQRSHVLVLTSLYEGLSHTVLEACAAALPCVVSACGGNEEVITHNSDGVVVPPQDVDRLATVLARLRDDEPWRRRLGAAAAGTAQRFDLDDTVAATEAILTQDAIVPHGDTRASLNRAAFVDRDASSTPRAAR